MANVRLIARLDIKAPNLIKGVHLEGLRKIGDPQEHARPTTRQGADEIDLHGHRCQPLTIATAYLTSCVAPPSRSSFRSPSAAACAPSDDVEMALRRAPTRWRSTPLLIARPGSDRRGRQALRLAVHGAFDRGQAHVRRPLGGLYRQRPRAHRPRRRRMGEARCRPRRRRDPADLGRSEGTRRGFDVALNPRRR